MRWLPFRRRKAECDEALAAKIQSEIDYKIAKEQHDRVSKQTGELDQVNRRNHFSESIRLAFGGGKL